MFVGLLSCIVCVFAVDLEVLLEEDELVAAVEVEVLLAVELLDDEVADDGSGLSGLVESSSGRTSSLGISGLCVIPLKLE